MVRMGNKLGIFLHLVLIHLLARGSNQHSMTKRQACKAICGNPHPRDIIDDRWGPELLPRSLRQRFPFPGRNRHRYSLPGPIRRPGPLPRQYGFPIDEPIPDYEPLPLSSLARRPLGYGHHKHPRRKVYHLPQVLSELYGRRPHHKHGHHVHSSSESDSMEHYDPWLTKQGWAWPNVYPDPIKLPPGAGRPFAPVAPPKPVVARRAPGILPPPTPLPPTPPPPQIPLPQVPPQVPPPPPPAPINPPPPPPPPPTSPPLQSPPQPPKAPSPPPPQPPQPPPNDDASGSK